MEWYTLPSMPTPRFTAGICTTLDGRIIVAGGIVQLDPDNGVANPACYVEEGLRMRGQPDREAGDTYKWRGRHSQRGTSTDAVELFDPVSATWQSLPCLPQPRAGARACVDEERQRLLVIGGSTADVSFTRDVEVFALRTNQWIPNEDGRVVKPMVKCRTEFGLTLCPGKGIFAVGGTNRYLWPNSPVTREICAFGTREWSMLPE
jgi:hypothetical protein